MDNYQRGDGPGHRGNNQGGGNNQRPGNNGNHSSLLIFLVVTLVTLLVMSFVNNTVKDSTSQEITYNEFLELLSKGSVERVDIDTNKLTITPSRDCFLPCVRTFRPSCCLRAASCEVRPFCMFSSISHKPLFFPDIIKDRVRQHSGIYIPWSLWTQYLPPTHFNGMDFICREKEVSVRSDTPSAKPW